jgi:hypothetical protein
MRTILFSVTAVFAIFAIAGVAQVNAAETVCKGLATAACSSNDGCSWVKSYKTKKGKEVAGFCRKKVSRKPTKAKTAG